jgi:hypothetical protein
MASGGNQAVFSLLSPLAVPLLLKPRVALLLLELGGRREQDPEQHELTGTGHPAGLEPRVHRCGGPDPGRGAHRR